jgi:hypothetical protein
LWTHLPSTLPKKPELLRKPDDKPSPDDEAGDSFDLDAEAVADIAAEAITKLRKVFDLRPAAAVKLKVNVRFPVGYPPTEDALTRWIKLLDTKIAEASTTTSVDPWAAAFQTAAVTGRGGGASGLPRVNERAGEDSDGSEARAAKTARNKKKKDAKRRKRESLESVSSTASTDTVAEEGRLKDSGWGTRQVKLTRFADCLSAFIRKTPVPVEMGLGPSDGYAGLLFIEFATSCGRRSLVSWMENQFDKEMAVKHGASYATRPPREVHELRFLVFVLDLALQDASCVEDTLSGSSMLVDILGRRLFASYQVLAGEMFWPVAERFLPVGAVKRDPGVPAWKLLGIAKEVKREEKAKAVLRGEATAKATPGKPPA